MPQIKPEYGKYLAVSCTGCHWANIKGGDGLIPGSQVVPNVTTIGKLSYWSEEQFINTLRTGVTPEGIKIHLNLCLGKARRNIRMSKLNRFIFI